MTFTAAIPGLELSEGQCEQAANRLSQGVLDFSGASA